MKRREAWGLMPRVTATEVKAALAEAEVVPSKKLGQNFLIDENTARWIVDQLAPAPDDFVVEVGPGTGALSEQLCGRVRRLVLVEYDHRLADWLSRRFADRGEVEVIHADGAKFDLRPLFKERPVKLLGNLPYSAGGAILRNFLKQPTPVTRAVLMLQKEFIDRILAKPRTKAYGVLSLRMQSEWDSRPLKTVPPECFHPRPLVDSTVMVTEPRRGDLPCHDRRLFDELIRRGFAQRRKQLRKALPASPAWEEVSSRLGLPETARAEELSLAQWVELARCYDDHPLKESPQRPEELFDVVDGDDRVVGQEERAVVHARGLKHRAVHIFLFNKRGELFLQKRSALKDVHPGRWDSSAAGHLDAGEDYPEAAARELAEELGQSGVDLRRVGKLPPSEATGWEFVELYGGRQEGPVRFPCSEIEAGVWLPLPEVAAWSARHPEDFATGFLACWELWERTRAE